MANQEQLKILKSGVKNWNRWRVENPYERIKLNNTDLSNTNFDKANLSGVDLSGSDLEWANLIETNFCKADLHEANLRGATLYKANLNDVNLSDANLQMTDFSNAILNRANLKRANLSKASLTDANMTNASLFGAILSNANFSRANLSKADFGVADLTGANLRLTNLNRAMLNDANLSRVDLRMAVLSRAYLTNANFNNASIGFTIFSDIDLSDVVGLDSCKHSSNSYIDYHTLQISKNLPISFLRGCGLPDIYINHIQSLYQLPTQYYYCLIGYSRDDQAFAEKLFSDLQKKGIRVWYTPVDDIEDTKIIDQIDLYSKVTYQPLLILSDKSIESEWIKTEIAKILKMSRELGNQTPLLISIIPFEKFKEWDNINSYYGKDLVREIQESYLLNFENWKDHDEYKQNFDRLVESLRIESDKNTEV